MPVIYGPAWAFALVEAGTLIDAREALTNQRKLDKVLKSKAPSPPKAIADELEQRKRIDEALARPMPARPPELDAMMSGRPITPDPAADPQRPPPMNDVEARADAALASMPPAPTEVELAPEPGLPVPPIDATVGEDGLLHLGAEPGATP